MTGDLPDAVRRGVDALRTGRPADAVDALSPVVADPALAAAPDLVDVRARVLVLYAQALVDSGRYNEAKAAIPEALRAVRRLDDDAGIAAVKQLQARLVRDIADDHRRASEAIERAKVARTPIDELLAAATSPEQRGEVLVQKANAMIDTGSLVEGGAYADEALALAVAAGNVREEVLARLSIARARPDEAATHVGAAFACAERAGDFNLVGTVARAAALHGVPLPAKRYGERPTE